MDNFRCYIKLDRKIPEVIYKQVSLSTSWKSYYQWKKAGKPVPDLSDVPNGSKGDVIRSWWQGVQDEKAENRYHNRLSQVRKAVEKHRFLKLDRMEMDIVDLMERAGRELRPEKRKPILEFAIKSWLAQGGNSKQLQSIMDRWKAGDA